LVKKQKGYKKSLFQLTFHFCNTNISSLYYSHTVFVLGWALKENQKVSKREPIKRITARVKQLLEVMFYTGTANPRQKMSAQQMRTNLLERVKSNEIEVDEVPKVTTIANWISGFSRQWKTAMAERSLEAAEASGIS